MPTKIRGLLEAESGAFDSYRYEWQFEKALRELWEPEPEEPASYSYSQDFGAPRSSLVEPEPLEWSIAFTPAFKKAIAAVDKKLQGRVLAALSELSEKPTTPHGDTRKALSGDLRGLWRHRCGDYRLVYKPQEQTRVVVLVDFAARGSVYEA
jgi:mRNA-degrading endonuclease RelE of RelBE toxin-antitoxin system